MQLIIFSRQIEDLSNNFFLYDSKDRKIMCSLEEANDAYKYIGLPGYNPHVKKEVFFKYYETILARDNDLINKMIDDRTEPIKSDKSNSVNVLTEREKILLINSRRVFHIAENGRNYKEREELARNYFDKVTAMEQMASDNSSEYFKKQDLFLQIYMNKFGKDQNIYGFRPIKINSYLFNRLLKNGYLIGSYKDLKRNIDWCYFPIGKLPKEEITYICASSYFKKKERMRLSDNLIKILDRINDRYRSDYSWVFWPDLD